MIGSDASCEVVRNTMTQWALDLLFDDPRGTDAFVWQRILPDFL
jgi:hypothetical protein